MTETFSIDSKRVRISCVFLDLGSVSTGWDALLYALLFTTDKRLSFLIVFLFLLFGVSTAFAHLGLFPVFELPTILSVTQSSLGLISS